MSKKSFKCKYLELFLKISPKIKITYTIKLFQDHTTNYEAESCQIIKWA